MRNATTEELHKELCDALDGWREGTEPAEVVVNAIFALALKASGGVVKTDKKQENRT